MEEDDKPLTMRLAEEGVDNPVAYEAASEAERRRLEAERERMKAKSFGQTFAEEADLPGLIEVMMEGVVKAFAAGQGLQQRQQQSAPVVTREPSQSAQETAQESRDVAERSPLAEEVDIDGGES